jgi:uncharacterized membrane protein HdeD (DUF308 family)
MNIVENLGSILSRTWWLMLLRGLVAIGFGILVLTKPQISLQVLVYLFGVYALVEGILGVALAVHARNERDSWGLLLLWGLLGVGVGILAFVKPDITALALLFYIALWAIATGVLEIAAAIRLREVIKNEWLLIIAGLVSVAFGVLLIARPDVGVLAVLALIGAYAIVLGALLVLFAFKIRSFVSKVTGAVSGRVA